MSEPRPVVMRLLDGTRLVVDREYPGGLVFYREQNRSVWERLLDEEDRHLGPSTAKR